MKKTKLFVFLLLGLILAASTVFAGGNQGTKSSGGKTLEYWTVFTGPDGTTMQAMVDAWNATNPPYTVNHRPMVADDLYLKLPLAVQSQVDVPDIAINHVERLPLHATNRFIENIAPFLGNSKIKKANYIEALWNASDLNGGHYGIPLDINGQVMFVNMDLYAKYGRGALDKGYVTWNDIMTSGPAAVADGILPVSIGWPRGIFLSQYGQLGGTMTNDGRTAVLNDANARRVLQTWAELQRAGFAQKEGDDTDALFYGNKIIYGVMGTWNLNSMRDSGGNYKMVEFPAYDANTRGSWFSSHQFVLPRNTKRDAQKTAAALDFINFIGEQSMMWAETGQIPARTDVTNNPRFNAMPQAFIAKSPSSMLKVYTFPYYGYAVEALDKVLGEILYGRMSIEAGLRQAEQETNDRIRAGG